MSMDFNNALQRLTELSNIKPKKYGKDSYLCVCPAHNDIGPSLSIKDADGRALFYCFAGCDYTEILDALGNPLTPKKILEQQVPLHKRKIVARYPYHNENGEVVFEKVRLEPKSFMIRHRQQNGSGFKWGLGDHDPVLYNLPGVIADNVILIVEGEKDVDRLVTNGFTATCNFEGASKSLKNPKWRPEYSKFLEGKYIIILPDNDRAGITHANFIYDSLVDVADKQIIMLPGLATKQDVSDWFNLGWTATDLWKILYTTRATY